MRIMLTQSCCLPVIRAGNWGIHDVDIPSHPWNQGLFWSYMNRVFYTPLLILVKISALLYLLRLSGTKRSVRLACRALIGFSLLQLLAFFPATVFMCQPIQYAWLGAGTGRSFRADLFAAALGSTNVLTDVMTLLIPLVAFLGTTCIRTLRWGTSSVPARARRRMPPSPRSGERSCGCSGLVRPAVSALSPRGDGHPRAEGGGGWCDGGREGPLQP